MAFPSGYSLYQEVVIQSSEVTADLTDFVVLIDLADLVKAGNDVFDTCLSDGGDIRVTKSDGTTELAREIVNIDTGAKTGFMYVKFSGTLSSSSNTTIRIWYNGSDSEPATTATYGSEAVWSNFAAAYHFESSPNDASGNSVDLTASGDAGYATAQYGDGADFDGNSDYFAGASGSVLDFTSDFSVILWYEADAFGNGLHTIIDKWGGNGDRQYRLLYKSDAPEGFLGFLSSNGLGGSGATQFNITFASALSTGTPYRLALVYDASAGEMTGYVNGASEGVAGSQKTSLNSGGNAPHIGDNVGGTTSRTMEGTFDEYFVVGSELDSDWMATDYNNQNSPSTFYSVGVEQTSTSGGVVQPRWLGTFGGI